MVTVPLLFAWTSLADGVRTAYEPSRPIRWPPVLSLTVLPVGMLAVLRRQQHLWDLMFMYASGNASAAQLVHNVMAQYFGGIMPLGILTPPALLIVGALVFGAAAALVPGIQVGQAETRKVPPSPHP